MNPECKDCYHAIGERRDHCGKSVLTREPTTYAPVKFARSLPRLFAWLQGECGKSGRFFEARYPF